MVVIFCKSLKLKGKTQGDRYLEFFDEKNLQKEIDKG